MPTPPVALTVFRGRAGDRNPRAMRGAELLGAAASEALGVAPRLVADAAPPEGGAGWRDQLELARPGLRALQAALGEAFAAGLAPVTVAGRCAASIGTLPAFARARPDAALVWFDAHADLNTPGDTPTGYLGGMVIVGAAGRWDTGLGAGLDLSRVVLVGARDLDPAERALVERGEVALVPPGPGIAARLRAALRGRPAYVHVDCDVLEPGQVPHEYSVEGGLDLADLRACAEELSRGEVVGLEVAEFESSWPDGRPGDPTPLVAALSPLLETLSRRAPGAAAPAGPGRAAPGGPARIR